jgi:hypothetical protein
MKATGLPKTDLSHIQGTECLESLPIVRIAPFLISTPIGPDI